EVGPQHRVARGGGAGEHGAPQRGVGPLHVLVELVEERRRIVAHLTTAAIRPRPASTATTQMATLPTTLTIATATAPERHTATVSLANAEKVVNPPRKPTISSERA